MDKEQLDERLVKVVPSKRQVAQQQMEFYSFVHFTVNTYTGREWGDGTEPEEIFNPEKLDAMQWVKAIKSAGMKGMILTCKHHDGFCLWPSAYTGHTIAQSPYKEGKGDIVREVSDACRAEGIRFGIYLSPWDRNNKTYGYGKAYDDYFVNQLTELLTGYGEICSVWFDGACGEGENGKKQVYDWARYYEVIRTLQPDACIHVCGPDVRWCGNEAGDTRPSEWSVVPRRASETEKIAQESQQAEDTSFRERKIKATDQDLGSREVLELHGSVLRNYCMNCGKSFDLDDIIHSQGIPKCGCGGIIKPDVVLYEEGLDEDVLSRSVAAIRQAEVLIIGGTSLTVYPAAGLVRYYRGDKLVVINRTALDGAGADLTITEPIGSVMAQL